MKKTLLSLLLSAYLFSPNYIQAEEKPKQIKDASRDAVQLIEQFEGFRTYSYWDTDAWAIGYGTREGVKKGDKITREQAEIKLKKHLDNSVEPIINKYVKVPLSQGQYDALASFVYNLGESNFVNSTLLKKLNQRDYNGASREILKWKIKNDKVSEGLVKRRAQEYRLFNKK